MLCDELVKENTVFDVHYGRDYQICDCPVKCRSLHLVLAARDVERVMPTFLVLVAEVTVVLPAVLPALDSASVSCIHNPSHFQFIIQAIYAQNQFTNIFQVNPLLANEDKTEGNYTNLCGKLYVIHYSSKA